MGIEVKHLAIEFLGESPVLVGEGGVSLAKKYSDLIRVRG
jgi:hypothetical protein